MSQSHFLESSIIILAHPDDEVLWFSSILDKVHEILLCYINCNSNTKWTFGRKKVLSEYPLKNISYLDFDESGVFNSANWQKPEITKFGIEIFNKNISDKNYIENYYKLRDHLKNKLMDYDNVFTHNPWGEYGNEEHVQVYKVVKELQEDMKFNLWFSNYCSNKSINLMLRYLSEPYSEYITKKINKILSNDIIKLYKKNGCWTWYDDWECFNEESFIKEKTVDDTEKKYGHIFPINMINVDFTKESKEKTNIYSLLISKILKMRRKK